MHLDTITVPFWVGVLSSFGTLAGVCITGWVALRGKRIDGPQATLNALISSAPELLSNNLKSLSEIIRLTGEVGQHLNTIEALRDEVKHRDDQIRAKDALILALQPTAPKDSVPQDSPGEDAPPKDPILKDPILKDPILKGQRQ